MEGVLVRPRRFGTRCLVFRVVKILRTFYDLHDIGMKTSTFVLTKQHDIDFHLFFGQRNYNANEFLDKNG